MLTIDFKGKTALVTGVSSGIGRCIAEMFAKAGADIAGCSRSKKENDFAELIQPYNVNYLYQPCDVTNENDLSDLVDTVVERFGRIDFLVSNAGKNVFRGAEMCTQTEWDANMQLNLTSHWQLAKLCKPYLEKTQGVIIIMASNHAFSTIPGCFPYNVTKTALTGLVRSLAIEWGPIIRTVGIAPGFIDTEGNQMWFDSFPDAAAERMRTETMHPVKRIGTSEEVGAWCVFLASKYSAFASGATYLLDGGRSALMQD